MKVCYEWDAEEYYPNECIGILANDGLVEAGEIHDHNYSEKAIEALRAVRRGYGDPRIDVRLVLVRQTVDKYGSVSEWAWAYVKDGKLPEFFSDAFDRQITKVPKKFIAELESAYRAVEEEGSPA